jgi:hypothetical protein
VGPLFAPPQQIYRLIVGGVGNELETAQSFQGDNFSASNRTCGHHERLLVTIYKLTRCGQQGQPGTTLGTGYRLRMKTSIRRIFVFPAAR